METQPLHPRFGVEVVGIDLRDVRAGHHYPEIRDLFERHSLLLFRGQSLDQDAHNDLAQLFGPIEDRVADAAGTPPRERPPVPCLSNRHLKNGEMLKPDSLAVLNLIANQFWHTDSTFLRTPALINLITAKVVPSAGGETELVSTRAAYGDLPRDLRAKADEAVFLHSVMLSRTRVDHSLLSRDDVSRYQGNAWRAVWPNPVSGEKALYIAEHIYGARGMADGDAHQLAADLIAFSTRPEYIYTHSWQPGDVLIWDERATMHRGRPWSYDEERTLYSTCVSARDVDGLAAVTPADGAIRPDEVYVPPAA